MSKVFKDYDGNTINIATDDYVSSNYSGKDHTHNYAGSATPGGAATSASKLTNTKAIGSSTQPVYFSTSGVPVATTYTLGKSVPSTAVFTDTTYSAATTSANGLMSSTDKSKLDGIATGANAYTHPTSTGNKHIPSGGKSGDILKWSQDGTATWGAETGTTAVATATANGLMSSTDKSKLDGIATGANKYTHPSSHAATMITQDTTHRFVTDTEKSTWDGKASTSVATTSANGLMSSTDKSKLNGIAAGANAYTHPSSHAATMITTDSTHRFVTDTEKSTWNAKASTSVATTSANGLMSSTDKSKLQSGVFVYTDTSTEQAPAESVEEVYKDQLSTLATDVGNIKSSYQNFTVSGKNNPLLNIIYPVGAVYISVSSTSPATLFGGTWVQIKDTFLLSAGSTYTAGSTGGKATHTLVENELPSSILLRRTANFTKTLSGGSWGAVNAVSGNWYWSSVKDFGSYDSSIGGTGGAAHNNMPPYLAVYMWKRTA